MKWLASGLCIGFLVIAVPGMAGPPTAAEIRFGNTISVGEVTPTPEMWFYQQYVRQYQDPKLAVRSKAEERAAQRRGRIASRQWFGFSNARPKAGIDPIHSDYSPAWTSRRTDTPRPAACSPAISSRPESRSPGPPRPPASLHSAPPRWSPAPSERAAPPRCPTPAPEPATCWPGSSWPPPIPPDVPRSFAPATSAPAPASPPPDRR